MAIRDWSRRRLALTWVIGVALEALLIVVPIIQRRAQMARLQREQDALLKHSHPLSNVRRDSVLKQLRDSTGVGIVLRNDTIVDITLSPEAQRKLDRAGPAIQRGFMMIAIAALVVSAMIYLPIPLFLIAITLTWQRARKHTLAEALRAHVA